MPAGALLLLVLFAVLARPEPSAHVRVATEGETPPTTEQPPASEDPTDTTTSSSTTTTTTARPGTPAPAFSDPTRSVPPVTTPSNETTRQLVGGYPETPEYATGHPLLVDPEGDAKSYTPGTTSESDPTRDITVVDVTGNATAVTMELRILDLTWRGEPGEHSDRVYRATLKRPDGYFTFYLDAKLAQGTFAARGTFWKPTVAVGDDVGAYSAPHDVDGVVASMNTKTGIVRMAATYEAMNRALASAFTTYEPVRRGSTVVPQGDTELDYVESPDRDFAYRLGD